MEADIFWQQSSVDSHVFVDSEGTLMFRVSEVAPELHEAALLDAIHDAPRNIRTRTRRADTLQRGIITALNQINKGNPPEVIVNTLQTALQTASPTTTELRSGEA